MTAAREINALVASVAVHALVLAALMLVREPVRELPPVVVLRLSLPAAGSAAHSFADSSEAVAGPAASAAAPERPAAGGGGLPALVTPRGGLAAGTLGAPARSGTETAGTVALPDPGTALAGALAAAAREAGPGAAAPAAATDTLLPRLMRSGLPAVKHGIALPYPPELIRRGIEADVEIRLTVAVDGTVAGAEVVRSSGLSSVDAEVAQALRQFLFASSGDTPVTGTIRVSYRLERGF